MSAALLDLLVVYNDKSNHIKVSKDFQRFILY